MLYYAQGTALIDEDELKKNRSKLSRFYTDLEKGIKPDSIPFSTGWLTPETALPIHIAGEKEGPEIAPYTPIGIGKPLLVTLEKIYTGKHPFSLIGQGKDMLVTSAIKGLMEQNAQAQMVNFLKPNVHPKSLFNGPGGNELGTPIIFYSPAVLEGVYFLDLSVIFDNFPEGVFNALSDALGKAAEIPVFVSPGLKGISTSVFLIAAGGLVKIAGDVGKTLFEGSPSLEASIDLRIRSAGHPVAIAGPILVVNQHDAEFVKKHHVDKKSFEVVNEFGNEYRGPIPYAVIRLDGTPDDRLKKFTPMAASAAILSRFLSKESNGPSTADSLLRALQLFSDVKFRQEVDRLEQEIEKKSKEYEERLQEVSDSSLREQLEKERDDEIKELTEQRNAQADNIVNDLLKKIK